MAEPTPTPYETRLMQEVEAIDARIKDLGQEKAALLRQLMKARWENNSLRDVSRKNSATRIMVEQRVLTELQAATRPVSVSRLFAAAKQANYELRENTFRTYLHRLKEKGLIESPTRGTWRLARKSAL
jgi:hypothetical protein